MKLDAVAAFKFCQNHKLINNQRIFVFGQSLGGAVAAFLAHQKEEVSGLIMENTFTSMHDLINHHAPFFSIFWTLIQKVRWPTIEILPDVSCPILIVRGLKDTGIPSD